MLRGQVPASSQPPVGEPSDKLVDIVNSAGVGVDTDVSLVNLGPMMADLIWIEGLPLRCGPTVLRARDDFHRYLLGRATSWRYRRLHDDHP